MSLVMPHPVPLKPLALTVVTPPSASTPHTPRSKSLYESNESSHISDGYRATDRRLYVVDRVPISDADDVRRSRPSDESGTKSSTVRNEGNAYYGVASVSNGRSEESGPA